MTTESRVRTETDPSHPQTPYDSDQRRVFCVPRGPPGVEGRQACRPDGSLIG